MHDDVKRFLERARAVRATSAAEARVVPFEELHPPRLESKAAEEPWGLEVLRGRLVELSARGATGALTMAVTLVVEAQVAAEPVAWITMSSGSFFPPDAKEAGVDLDALVVVRAPTVIAAARAAERLLRSGAFGLVVMDLAMPGAPSAMPAEIVFPSPVQGRLVTLAQTHDAVVVCLTAKPDEAASLGSLVSLRASVRRERDGPGEPLVTLRALKDKRRGPGWVRSTKARGPAGY